MISLVAQKQVAADCTVVKRLCKTLSIGRSSYYRGRRGRPDPDLELRDQDPQARPFLALLRLPSHDPCAAASWIPCEPQADPKRLMREDNLLVLRRKAFVSTTDSNHDRAVYANLVPGLSVTASTSCGYPTSPT